MTYIFHEEVNKYNKFYKIKYYIYFNIIYSVYSQVIFYIFMKYTNIKILK